MDFNLLSLKLYVFCVYIATQQIGSTEAAKNVQIITDLEIVQKLTEEYVSRHISRIRSGKADLVNVR